MNIQGRINIDGSKSYINKRGKKINQDFQRELINRSKELSIKIQQDLSNSIDQGPVPFSNKAILFTFSKTTTGVKATILVKNIQAQYLYDVIVDTSTKRRFVPTSKAKLTKQGNIRGLRSNLKSGKYKIVTSKNGKKRLIDTKQKKRENRLIALYIRKRRKMVYDFYNETQKGFMMIISDVRGTFKVKNG